jgi:2-alkyl-3-oxoalkanoate reductase
VRVFLAGASGAIGRRLVPLLLDAGHEVTGTTRSGERAEQLRRAGASAVVLDALDATAMSAALAAAAPEAVINQLTALPKRIDPRTIGRDFALNDRLRREGSQILTAAARDAGATRLVAQSIAFMYEPGPPGTVHGEDDPLLRDPPASFARTAAAVRTLEETVLGAGGVVLRYGYFYGPGSAIASDGSLVDEVRRRRMPIVGRGGGVWSFVQIDDAAAATVAALSHGAGVYNVVDDEPAPVSAWLPALAGAVGAPRPMRAPRLLARLAAGEYAVATMTAAQGASNEKAKRELGWTPAHASWREGFRRALG